MTNQLFQNVNELSETTKKKIETRLLRFGNQVKAIISTLFITHISYKSDNRHGLHFRMINGTPFVVNDNYLKTTEI